MVKLLKISGGFARENHIPVYFTGEILIETAKAIYVYGRGTTQTKAIGRCCVCGRTLTHPVSVILGIGPECGKHWHDWDAIGGYTAENIELLTKKVEEIKIDQWIPKACVLEITDTTETIEIPADHKMVHRTEEKKMAKPAEKLASVITTKKTPEVKITFPFNVETLAQVKSLPQRTWKPTEKFWLAPLTLETLLQLEKFGFTLDQALTTFKKNATLDITKMEGLEVKDLQGGELMPFQKKGVEFIEARNGRVLLADEMGLGKTVQALAWLKLHPELRPVVVVCPATLKWNWAQEIKKWLGEDTKIQILNGEIGKPLGNSTDIYIINYDILRNKQKKIEREMVEITHSGWVDYLKDINPTVIIMDEAHAIKDNKAQRTQAAKKLCRGVDHILALSGTPATSRPIELYNALTLIDRSVVPSFWTFVHRYCGAKRNRFGWDFTGSSNAEELHRKLVSTIMIRRLKADVLKDLPPKIYSSIPIELSNDAEYNRAANDFLGWIQATKGTAAAGAASRAETLVKIGALKQLAVAGKMKQAMDWVEEMLDANGKLVLFAEHTAIIDQLMARFGKIAVKIDGSVTGEKRQEAVESFQNNDKIRLLVGNIKAAGEGITLTASHNVAFLEFPWTPAALVQAEDRCHRIGQTKGVNVYYLVAHNTIEEDIVQLLDKKRITLDKILDGIDTDEESLLKTIIAKIKGGK